MRPEAQSPESAYCQEHFGSIWLQRWNAVAELDCVPPATPHGAGHASRVICRRRHDEHMPAASAPHSLCDLENVVIDPSLAPRAPCPRHRPGYMCTSRTYHRYDPGSFRVRCAWGGGAFNASRYSRDHGRDIFEAVSAGADASEDVTQAPTAASLPTLLVTREIHEHANLYHTLTDLLNAHVTLRVLGWTRWSVLLMDDHPAGGMDEFWARLEAAGRGEAVGEAAAVGGGRRPTRFLRAAVPPPGYSSLLFAHLYEDNSCAENTELFRGFRLFILELFGIRDKGGRDGGASLKELSTKGAAPAPLRMTVISRRLGPKRRRLARRIANEDALLAALRSLGPLDGRSVEAELVDMGALSLGAQLRLVQQTDLLVGMHGAGLAHALLARPGSALLELWPQRDGIWRCYEHFAEWAGLEYGRWANPDPGRHRKDGSGDLTTVDEVAVARLAEELLRRVAAR
ncbi:hypothetical protein QBZ16_004751 [Prototheca wickerhamii]|uniref:EGF domain-specific O-linked N-acetylglucosamine transferase n=1 Tax=Prototheca wickerhamii TaxID=3111 RepID=A0AAD9MHN8_PROWI|nr:hypothetical protein QBZ16_004751 [Prototheca wickerhamii]